MGLISVYIFKKKFLTGIEVRMSGEGVEILVSMSTVKPALLLPEGVLTHG